MSISFSIVIPLYNKEADILTTVNSVIGQSYSNFELIVVDDGSSDNSANILNVGVNDNRFRYIKQTNSGVSVARNHGISVSSGDYICLLDADDILHVDYLMYICEAIQSHKGADFISVGSKVLSEGCLLCENDLGVLNLKSYKWPLLEFAKNPHMVNSSSVCFSRKFLSLYPELRFPVGVTRGEDIHLWLRVFRVANLLYVDNELVFINRGGSNRSASRPLVDIPEYFRLILSLISAENDDAVNLFDKIAYYIFFVRSMTFTLAYNRLHFSSVSSFFISVIRQSHVGFFMKCLLVFFAKIIDFVPLNIIRYIRYGRSC